MGRVVLGHVFGRYLPPSEVFSYELLQSLTAFEHHVYASRLENVDRFPVTSLHQPTSPEEYSALARRHGVSLLVAHFGPLGTTAMPVALLNGIPAVTIFHGYDVSMLLREPQWVERYRSLAALGMQAICISEAGRQRLLAIGWPETRVRTIHLGVDTSRIRFMARGPAGGSPIRLVMVARLVPKKGIQVAIRAVASLRAAGIQAELTVIGEGPERASLEALVDTLDLHGAVHLAGARHHADVLRALAGADILVQSSVTAPDGDQEGIPVALMEAQAHGVPVVASRHSGIPELIVDGETGLLVDEHDVAGLASAIAALAANRILARRLATAGRHRVEQAFDRTRQAKAFTDCFHELVDTARRRPEPRSSGMRPRVLFVRSVPADAAVRKLLTLRFRHPAAHITVLTSASSASLYRDFPIVDSVVTYADGRLSLRRLGRDLIASLQARHFDLVVAAYPTDDGAGFANVRRVVRALGGRRRVALTGRDVEVPIAGAPRPLLAAVPTALGRPA